MALFFLHDTLGQGFGHISTLGRFLILSTWLLFVLSLISFFFCSTFSSRPGGPWKMVGRLGKEAPSGPVSPVLGCMIW